MFVLCFDGWFVLGVLLVSMLNNFKIITLLFGLRGLLCGVGCWLVYLYVDVLVLGG